MKIGLYSRLLKPEDKVFVQLLLDALRAQQFETTVYAAYYRQLQAQGLTTEGIRQFDDGETLGGQMDFLLSIGGDGTLLDTLALVRDTGIPILGINTGRMGFLADLNRDQLDSGLQPCTTATFGWMSARWCAWKVRRNPLARSMLR